VDEMTALRRMRAEIPRPHPDRLTAGRERLQAAIDEELATSRVVSDDQTVTGGIMIDIVANDSERRSRNLLRRRPLLSVAVAATAAIAVIGTIVVADDIGDDKEKTKAKTYVNDVASTHAVSAKKFLNAAADRARKEGEPETEFPRDEQFVYTREFVQETVNKTGKKRTYADEIWDSVDGSRRSYEIKREKGIWQEKLGKGWTKNPIHDWNKLDKLPADDPDELIKSTSTRMAGPPGGKSIPLEDFDKTTWQFVYSDLISLVTAEPVLPEGLRATAFEALAKVPGIKATAGMTDAKGRPGVGISYSKGRSKSYMRILAEDDYSYIGYQYGRSGSSGKLLLSSLEKFAVVDKVKRRP
jgi:hypothetical protein